MDAINHEAETEAPMRQMVMVGGPSVQQHAQGIAYESTTVECVPDENQTTTYTTKARKDGLLADIYADLGLPPTFDPTLPFTKTKTVVYSLFDEISSNSSPKEQLPRRPLDADEKRGVWVLLLIIGASWLAGGLFAKANQKKKNRTFEHGRSQL
jgi:hypothetical protein